MFKLSKTNCKLSQRLHQPAKTPFVYIERRAAAMSPRGRSVRALLATLETFAAATKLTLVAEFLNCIQIILSCKFMTLFL